MRQGLFQEFEEGVIWKKDEFPREKLPRENPPTHGMPRALAREAAVPGS